MGKRDTEKQREFIDITGRLLRTEDSEFRVFHTDRGKCYIAQISNRTVLTVMPERQLKEMLNTGEAEDITEDCPVIEESDIAEKELPKYRKRVEFIKQVEAEYGPDFLGLVESHKNGHPQLKRIIEDADLSNTSAWKYIRTYLQSGCNYTSLIDSRYYGHPTRGPYNYKDKPGKKPETPTGVVPSEKLNEIFEEYRQWKLKMLGKTWEDAFMQMSEDHFSEPVPGKPGVRRLLPESERPTRKQFYFYCEKMTAETEKIVAKYGATEARNSHRVFRGESKTGIYRCGQMMECDALETDVSLISSDRMHTVGRAVLYIGVDVATTAIVAYSVGYENNSYEGLSGLFLSLARDQVSFAEKFGFLDIDADDIPSGFIPESARCDGGPEFQGNNFEEFCNRAHIREDTAPVKTGSLKGVVESRFKDLQKDFKADFVGKGLITSDYNSKHHEQAQMTIDEFTELIIGLIVYHNRNILEEYKKTPEEISYGLQPSPKNIWKYLLEKEGAPKAITETNKTQYLWNLMVAGRAKISRKGIEFEHLNYWTDDEKIHDLMLKDNGKVKYIDVRYDPACVDCIYYIDSSDMKVMRLNPAIEASVAYKGMTFKEAKAFKKVESSQKREARAINDDNKYSRDTMVKQIVKSLQERPNEASSKDMRDARQKEKNKVTYERSISRELKEDINKPMAEVTEKEEASLSEYAAFDSISEAIAAATKRGK